MLHAAFALHVQEGIEVHRTNPSVHTAGIRLWGAADLGAGVAASAGH